VNGKVVAGQVLRSDGGAVEVEQTAAFEDPVDDGLGEVLVVQGLAPALRVLVGGEDHRPLADVSVGGAAS
jgi:hypothetical protein